MPPPSANRTTTAPASVTLSRACAPVEAPRHTANARRALLPIHLFRAFEPKQHQLRHDILKQLLPVEQPRKTTGPDDRRSLWQFELVEAATKRLAAQLLHQLPNRADV